MTLCAYHGPRRSLKVTIDLLVGASRTRGSESIPSGWLIQIRLIVQSTSLSTGGCPEDPLTWSC